MTKPKAVANAGIDYGHGTTNIDTNTGIRYGVIASHTVGFAWYEDSTADYGDPSCGECGSPAVEYDDDIHHDYEDVPWWRGIGSHGAALAHHRKADASDYACENCQTVFDSCDSMPDEPLGYTVEASDVTAYESGNSGIGIFVTKSEFYTFARFCSPCAPGAGDLDSPDKNGVKTYCFGPDWFEDDAPYRVYRVADDSLV